LGFFYIVAYLAAPALPGGFKFPLGWWGWSDQGLYLKSAQAFSRLDLRGTEHTYPILYSVFAAPFTRFMPIHPFFMIDLICFLIVAGIFVAIGSKSIGFLPSTAVFVCTLCIPWVLASVWIIPWTSTLAAALTSILLLCRADDRFAQGAAPPHRYLAFGLLCGLVVLCRPLDFIIDLSMCAYVGILSVSSAIRKKEPMWSGRLLTIAAAMVLGISIGPALMAGFNKIAYDSIISPYMQISRESGYDSQYCTFCCT
jgi:hypothetical protein